jgi:hypothetical protein
MTISEKAKKTKNLYAPVKFVGKPFSVLFPTHRYVANAQKNIFFDNEERVKIIKEKRQNLCLI